MRWWWEQTGLLQMVTQPTRLARTPSQSVLLTMGKHVSVFNVLSCQSIHCSAMQDMLRR